jgi:hypothetical protein
MLEHIQIFPYWTDMRPIKRTRRMGGLDGRPDALTTLLAIGNKSESTIDTYA